MATTPHPESVPGSNPMEAEPELVAEASESPEPLGVLDSSPGQVRDTENHGPVGMVDSTPEAALED